MSQLAPTPATAPPSAARPTQPEPPSQAQRDEVAVAVGPGARFEGLLTCLRPARIDGALRGDVIARDRIELGESASVRGRIEARDIVIAGHFEGELFASHSIELLPTARVAGDLRARELSAHEGCLVTGRCRTGASAVDPAPDAE